MVTDDVKMYAHGHDLLPDQRIARVMEGISIIPEEHTLCVTMEEK